MENDAAFAHRNCSRYEHTLENWMVLDILVHFFLLLLSGFLSILRGR